MMEECEKIVKSKRQSSRVVLLVMGYGDDLLVCFKKIIKRCVYLKVLFYPEIS